MREVPGEAARSTSCQAHCENAAAEEASHVAQPSFPTFPKAAREVSSDMKAGNQTIRSVVSSLFS
jgi:hypothetical protein